MNGVVHLVHITIFIFKTIIVEEALNPIVDGFEI
jgi:hypothetical protein